LRDQVNVERVQSGLQAHTGASDGGLAASVSGSDHDDVELFRELHE
jgi:hypothetical protein